MLCDAVMFLRTCSLNVTATDREIWRLTWPAIATNITTPLLSLADVAIVGHVQGGRLIGAVAVGGTVFNILYWLFAFLRMGTSGLTAQMFGAKDCHGQKVVLKRGLATALCGAALLLILTPFAGERIINLIDGSQAVGDDALIYFSYAILGAPGVLVSFVVSGWLLGLQRPKSIMAIAVGTNLLNILLSVVFVFGLHLGIKGVALGTALAQNTGALAGLLVVRKLLHGIKARTTKEDMKTPARETDISWSSMFRINKDIFFRTLCLSAVTTWFTHAGATFGAGILAANALLMQLFMVFSYFMDGFAFAGEAMAGRYLGARDGANLRKTVRRLLMWGIFMSVGFTFMYFVSGDLFLSWLTSDADTLAVASDFRLWTVVVPLAGFTAFTWDGILIGMTRTKYLLLSMASAMIVFFGVYFRGTAWFGKTLNPNHILWLAFILYLLTRGIVATALYKKYISNVYK